MKKLLHFKNEEEAEEYMNSKKEKVMVIYNNGVYDLTEFQDEHPGGSEIIEDYSGTDISEVFHSHSIHSHSGTARNMLNRFQIGQISLVDEIETTDSLKTEQSVSYPIQTEKKIQYKNFSIDLSKGIICQVYQLNKANYMDFIHNSVQVPYARLYDTPILEFVTRTKYYIIPIIWIPLSLLFLYFGVTYEYKQERSILTPYLYKNGDNFNYLWVLLVYLFGVLCWTKVEYILHRFLFHCDNKLPDFKPLLHIHFLLHGIHHAIPMDKDRLVMPPVLSSILAVVVFNAVTFIVGSNTGRIIFAGILLGYVGYDLTHYYIHHGSPWIDHFKTMKSHHNKHHYRDGNLGFGITTKLWDVVYGTGFENT